MSDIIKLLPDAIANQIAAGEVVQRPASVIKELMDNAIDAGSTRINVIVEQAGKNLIQVIDNGSGMSITDARMSFERHATSKIRKADDLFAIQTKGFRGEALASIAAVASVELKTKQKNDALGTKIIIKGSELISQEQVNCKNGSQFIVKNLFFNIPARRKFLKTDTTELRHIVNEFHRLALAHPEVEMTLTNGDSELFNLKNTSLKHRIIQLFGSTKQSKLIPINSETSYANIEGYIGKPDAAKKRFGEQFFFVNNRYIKHPYLHKSVMEAYGQLIQPQAVPSYFIFIEIDPSSLDINIHPTKTEVKFEDERTLFQIVLATIKEALGKHNIVPSIDFEENQGLDIPIQDSEREIRPPQISDNLDYNPFKPTTQLWQPPIERTPQNWEKFYDFEDIPQTEYEETPTQLSLDTDESEALNIIQLKGKYIISQVKSGIMFIHLRRAHERIVFERLLNITTGENIPTQRLLFPYVINLVTTDIETFAKIKEDLQNLGFDIDLLGKDSLTINGLPGGINIDSPQEFFEELLADYRGKEILQKQLTENIVGILAKKTSLAKNDQLSVEEAQKLMGDLFSCKIPNYTPDDKKIIYTMPIEDISKHF